MYPKLKATPFEFMGNAGVSESSGCRRLLLAALVLVAVCSGKLAIADDEADWREWSCRIKAIDPKSRTAQDIVPSLIATRSFFSPESIMDRLVRALSALSLSSFADGTKKHDELSPNVISVV